MLILRFNISHVVHVTRFPQAATRTNHSEIHILNICYIASKSLFLQCDNIYVKYRILPFLLAANLQFSKISTDKLKKYTRVFENNYLNLQTKPEGLPRDIAMRSF